MAALCLEQKELLRSPRAGAVVLLWGNGMAWGGLQTSQGVLLRRAGDTGVPAGDSPALAQAGAAWLGAAHGKGLGGQELDRRQRVPWQQGRTAASRAL